MPELPDPLGVAGPFVGVHRGALIVAGGANFPVAEGADLWTVPKVWHRQSWVLLRESDGRAEWHAGAPLENPRAYGASASTPDGVVCVGGSDGERTYSDAFLLQWDPLQEALTQVSLPPLPQPMAHGSAALVGDWVYVTSGQSTLSLD